MMIATIDKRHGTLKLTTLMRDMLVNIPGHGYGKLNSAAARGGIELLFQTIEEISILCSHNMCLLISICSLTSSTRLAASPSK